MRVTLTLLALAVGLSFTVMSAEAQQRKRGVASARAPSNTGPSYSNPNASSERTRADSRDPSGQYRGYPDWARSALSPQSGPGGR